MNLRRHASPFCITATIALALFIATPNPLAAQEAQPGDACAQAGAFRQSGGPEIAGGHFLVCDGSNWVSILDYADAGGTLTQVDYDAGNCDALKEGRLRFNSTGDLWEYCHSNAWAALGSGSAAALDDLTDATTNYASASMYIGQNAGSSVTTATENVVLGPDAGISISSGAKNTLIGATAGHDMTVGADNAFVGRLAGYRNDDSERSVALGSQALRYFNPPAGEAGNTAIGYQALLGTDGQSTGARNTAIGASSGDSITTGSDNILIGYDVDVPSPATSNFLNIGNVIYGSGGNVGIGTANPAAPFDVAGEIKFSSSGLTCGGTTEGTVRYTGGDPPWEFCNGSAWVPFKQPRCQDDATGECYLDVTRSNDDPDFVAANIADGVNILGVTGTLAASGGCTAPASCPNVGDVCSDGSLFAGFVLYNGDSCEPLYVTDNNQSTSSQWKNATGTDDISTDDHVDGQVNHANRGGSISDFPAFDLCESNTYHGKSDWYLPARAELNLLWLNRAAIDANAAGNFTTSLYWSSTEGSTNGAWFQDFGNYDQNDTFKTNSNDVRCVRRD